MQLRLNYTKEQMNASKQDHTSLPVKALTGNRNTVRPDKPLWGMMEVKQILIKQSAGKQNTRN